MYEGISESLHTLVSYLWIPSCWLLTLRNIDTGGRFVDMYSMCVGVIKEKIKEYFNLHATIL